VKLTADILPFTVVTSFPQYIIIAPSFINILNVYAFCNLHDVSWGTKGSDKADALPSVETKKDKGESGTVEEIEREQADIDANFKEVVGRAVSPVVKVQVKEIPTIDDSNKTFRTRLVAFWLLTNGALTVAIENVNGYNMNMTQSQIDMEQSNKQHICEYLASNILVTSMLTSFSSLTDFGIILWSTFGLTLFRFIGCLYYWIVRQSCRCFRKDRQW
jgi:chitin synthase